LLSALPAPTTGVKRCSPGADIARVRRWLPTPPGPAAPLSERLLFLRNASALVVVVTAILAVQIAISGYASTVLFIGLGPGLFSVVEFGLLARYYRRKERAAADEGPAPSNPEP
jgi:hypothetical protein